MEQKTDLDPWQVSKETEPQTPREFVAWMLDQLNEDVTTYDIRSKADHLGIGIATRNGVTFRILVIREEE